MRSAEKKAYVQPDAEQWHRDGAVTIARSMAEWENEDGELWTPVDAYTQADVDIFGVTLKWWGDAEAGMESLLAGGDVAGAVARELRRLRTSQPLPDGWHNHFNDGGDDVIFRSGGQEQIVCQSHKTGGLLRHPAHLETRIYPSFEALFDNPEQNSVNLRVFWPGFQPVFRDFWRFFAPLDGPIL